MASSPLRAQPRKSACHSSCQPRARVPSKQWLKPTAAAGTAGTNYIGASSYSRDHAPLHASERARPRTNELTLSILQRAKESGFTALVVTLDTFSIGWRTHDLDTAYLPFIAGVGIQVGTSDPFFMQRMGSRFGAARPDERPAFPLYLEAFRERLAAGDEQARDAFALASSWLGEVNSGIFRSWTDLAFLRQNWDGPIVLKGIQSVQDAHAAMDAHVDGILVSNHGTSLACGEVKPSTLVG
jgi:isopentenyl diphosphate isomerase/L-lactate dehydrogenase-like FMN-dependent dehydrogenase